MDNRIIIVCNSYASFGGNLFTSLSKLEKKILSLGDEVIVIFPSEAKQYSWTRQFKKAQFVSFTDKDVTSLKKTIINICKKDSKKNLIYLHFVSWRLALQLKKLNMSLLLHFHNHVNYHTGIKGVIKSLICKRVFNDCECICVSEDVAANVLLNSSLKSDRIHTLHNAIDFKRLELRDELNDNNIDKKFFNIIIMGTYDTAYRKGVDFAALATERLTKHGHFIKLNIVSNTDIPQNLLIEKGLSPEFIKQNVQFLPPIINIGKYYSQCDVLLALSREEGFNSSITEATWCGESVIATSCIGQRCNKTPGVFWVSNPMDTASEVIVTEVEHILDELYSKWEDNKEKNYKYKNQIEQMYSLDAWCDKIVDIIYNISAHNKKHV